jgi:peptidyl-prolyl cis-trans isomerase NIMA-interacting 1
MLTLRDLMRVRDDSRVEIGLTQCLVLSTLVASCGGARIEATEPTAAGSTASGDNQCLIDANAETSIPANAPSKVSVRHILVRHSGLNDTRGATLTREQACERALAALKALESGNVEWAAAVTEYSDAKDDNLGRVAPDELNPKFAAAAFSLEVDQLSYVVETDRGFHVIWREQ